MTPYMTGLGGFIKSTDSHAQASLKSLATTPHSPQSLSVCLSLCACVCLPCNFMRFFSTDDEKLIS
jgi:hypothetical protein